MTPAHKLVTCVQARQAKLWGVVLGTLGRQGNPRVFDHLCQALQTRQLPYIQVQPQSRLFWLPCCNSCQDLGCIAVWRLYRVYMRARFY